MSCFKLQQLFKNIISIDDVLDELLHTAYEEMNFLKEASYMEEFRQLNKDVAYVKIPKVYPEYSCEKVLVMEFIAGTLIADRQQLLNDGYDLLEIGSKLFIKRLIVEFFMLILIQTISLLKKAKLFT